jgi:HEAT repeat protein
LRAALEDPDPWVRYFAVGALELRVDAGASAALVRLARLDPATHVRIAAVQALGSLDAVAVTGVASELIRDADPDLAGAAIAALASAHGDQIESLLEEAVRSSNVACRAAAVQVLTARPGSRAVGVLLWAARADEPPGLGSVAIEGLRRIAASDGSGRPAAIQALLDVGSEPGRREEVVEALGGLTGDAADEIAAGLSAASANVRTTAVEALGRMRHPRASEALARALADDDPAVRTAAVTVFGRLGTHAVSGIIARMQTEDADPGVRRRAAAICARHGWSAM